MEIPGIEKIKINIEVLEIEGGYLCKFYYQEQSHRNPINETRFVSGNKDLLQLVTNNLKMCDNILQHYLS